MRIGVGHKIGGSRNVFFQPEFALVMPAYGNDPSNVADQLGYGEKQGADSGRPEVQARIVTQWRLDKAPGVAPAQLIFSGVQGQRKAMVRSTDIPLCTSTVLTVCPNPDIFKTAFRTAAQLTSNRAGWTAELQLPTRYVTLITKYWNGSDLRWYFVGGLLSNFNDVAGLAKNCVDTKGNPAFCEGLSNDGASALIFGVNGSGTASLASQRPVRSQGGFLNIAFPLSRIFNADAAGRNAGWQLVLHYAFDDANAHDVRMIGNTRQKNDLAAGTLSWKLSNLVSFVLEESLYRTRAVGDPTGLKPFPTYRSVPAQEWHDFRSEFGPIFTF